MFSYKKNRGFFFLVRTNVLHLHEWSCNHLSFKCTLCIWMTSTTTHRWRHKRRSRDRKNVTIKKTLRGREHVYIKKKKEKKGKKTRRKKVGNTGRNFRGLYTRGRRRRRRRRWLSKGSLFFILRRGTRSSRSLGQIFIFQFPPG